MHSVHKIIFIIIFFLNSPLYALENFIVLKVNNNIITKIDIENEYKYLIALNKSLKELEKDKIYSLAKDSIVRENIKKDEIEKFMSIDNYNEEYANSIFKNFYTNLGFSSAENFENYLSSYGIEFSNVKKKIFIEIAWNSFIYEKFINQIYIDEDSIKKKITKRYKDKKEITLYLLSEILFQTENVENLEKKSQEIDDSIMKYGFEATASIFSVSDTSKIGGKLDWIEENQLSENIKKKVKTLDIGNHTEPIVVPGAYLILKLNNIKSEKKSQVFDLNEELEKSIKFEQNRQLDKFSKIYFNRAKKNSYISE